MVDAGTRESTETGNVASPPGMGGLGARERLLCAVRRGPWGPGCHPFTADKPGGDSVGRDAAQPGSEEWAPERLWDVASAGALHLPTSPGGPSGTNFISRCGW